MAFFQPRFLGLSVRDFKPSLGWGQQVSSLNIQLVQDNLAGDLADIPSIGTPVYFQFGSFVFAGLLQKFFKSSSTSGLPVYEVTIIDPREILEGSQVITSAYHGTIPGGMSNVFNVYGYWENQGFGQSDSNPSAGMKWSKVLDAINTMANGGTVGSYGGPLKYRGISYALDISEVPHPPSFYRLPPGFLSLLEVINYICEDSGCDFYVTLVGLTIKINVVSRFFAPPLGTISALALSGTYSGSTISVENGIEARNETTSVILLGGDKTGVTISDTFYSYWGNDINNIPIVGEAGTLTDFGACEFANLNAADCADIIGSTTYRCSTFEMRFALWGKEMWLSFLGKARPTIAALVGSGLYGDNGIAFAPLFNPDLVKDGAANVANAFNEILQENGNRLFDLVRRYAEDFYGKQFLVLINNLQATQDSETGKITTSLEPTNAGLMEFGAASLGVPENRLDVLQEADERVVPFAYYQDITGADTGRINWSDTAVSEDAQMWCRTQISSRILFSAGIPYVHVKLGGVLYNIKTDQFGDSSLLAKVFGPTVGGANLLNVDANAFSGSLGYLGVYPAARYPTALGIPLKSNIEVYGPWFVVGASGKVRVEQDTSLTPWDYGSADIMDQAGQAKVLTALSNQQEMESGSMIVAGAPSYSIGGTMRTGGPNLTNMEIAFGPNGVTTSYRWQTFTPRFGLFSRQNSERLRRTAIGQVEQRREFRKLLNKAIVANVISDKAAKGAKFIDAFWNKRQSPHTVLMVQNVTNGSDTRVGAGLETYESALGMLTQGDNYADKALMSVSGLVRGYSTNPSATTKLAKYGTVDSFGGTNNPLTLNDYDPSITGNDIEVVSYGNTYAGAHSYRNANDPANTRLVGLKFPLMAVGYAPGIDGKKYPSDGGTGYLSGYLRKANEHIVAPIDMVYDNKRKVFTSHDIYTGVTATGIAPGATGGVNVGGDSGYQVNVYNQWSSAVASGKKCIIGYCVNDQRMHILSVDC